MPGADPLSPPRPPGGSTGEGSAPRPVAGPAGGARPALPAKALRRRTTRLGLRLLDGLLGFLPWRAVLAVGRALGWLGRHLQPRRRRRARQGLQRSLGGEHGREELRELERGVFANLGMNLAEICWVAAKPSRTDALVRFEGLEHLQAARDAGKGVVLITGHIGSWELMASAIVRAGIPLSVIARETPDGRVNEFLVGLRDRLGVRTVLRGSSAAARQILRTLRSGEVLGALIDQDIRAEGTFVPFFGRPAHTPTGPVSLALRAGAPVVIGATWREADGRHLVRFEPSRQLDAGAGLEEAVRRHTAALTGWLEERIREHPDQWVWIHRRWRRAPSPAEADSD